MIVLQHFSNHELIKLLNSKEGDTNTFNTIADAPYGESLDITTYTTGKHDVEYEVCIYLNNLPYTVAIIKKNKLENFLFNKKVEELLK